MNIQIQPDNSAMTPFVFRAADRMRIDGCANAVAREGLSLALYCPFEALLDHYLNLLLAKLQHLAPEHRIEVYFPANIDSLLDRFNEVLASQSLDQAIKTPSSVNQAQIWIVHDAQTLPESEIQLLARLIQNFPGANIRAVLLMSGSPQSGKTPLSAFGRKILRWDIEAPTEEQAQAALDQARLEGNFSAVQQLLQRIQRKSRPEVTLPLAAPLDSSAVAASLQPPATGLKSQMQKFHQKGQSILQSLGRSGQSLRDSPAWLRKNNKLAIGIALALSASTLMMLWIQPEAFGLPSGKKIPTPSLQSPQLAPTLPAAAPAQSSTEPVKTDIASATPPTSSPAAAMAKTPAELATEAPEAPLQAQSWVKQLDPDSFLIQHGTANTYEKVQEIQRRFPALKDAQIVAAYRPGEKLAHFVIVSGPYSPINKAYDAAKRSGIPNNSWVRGTRNLQDQLKAPL
jgi:hypothetical protein